MRRTVPGIICFAIGWLIPLSAAGDATDQIKEGLHKSFHAMASLQRHGGWATAWSGDGQGSLFPGGVQPPDAGIVQLPATPLIGMVFLRGYQLLGDESYLEIAKQAGDVLVQGQLECGGFAKEISVDSPNNGSGIFVDDTTQSAVRFLTRLWSVTKDQQYADAAERSIQFMLDAQLEHGGFPREYPPQDGEPQHIALHDGVMTNTLRSLLCCYETFGNKAYYEAAVRGMDCLVALQGEPPQAGWAQRYTQDGSPVSAGDCHPAALSTLETVDVIRWFMDWSVKTESKTYLPFIPAAIYWLQDAQLENGKWARFYEYGSNRAIYCREDGTHTHQTHETLNGVHQQGAFFNEDVALMFWPLSDAGPETLQREYDGFLQSRKDQREKEIQDILASLDDNGFWTIPTSSEHREAYSLQNGSASNATMIHSLVFVQNTNVLLDSLESE